MAENVANSINYYLVIEAQEESRLAHIRKWENLKIAYDHGKIWVTNFSDEQVKSKDVNSIPYKTIYEEKGGDLYVLNSILPVQKVPSLLWTPIQRAIPLEIGTLNHNYFGVEEKLIVELTPYEKEEKVNVLITPLALLKKEVYKMAENRLQPIEWTIVDRQAFLVGVPLLPVDGDVFWQRGNAIIPVGFDFTLPDLAEKAMHKIDAYNHFWIVWNKEGEYYKVPKAALMSFSISSFRKTMMEIMTEKENKND